MKRTGCDVGVGGGILYNWLEGLVQSRNLKYLIFYLQKLSCVSCPGLVILSLGTLVYVFFCILISDS